MVECLREWSGRAVVGPLAMKKLSADLNEAADEIERLRAALQSIANAYPGWYSHRVELLRERARTEQIRPHANK